MSANFYPYPSEFPGAEVSYLLGTLRGTSLAAGEATHAAWSLAGYAAKQVAGQPVPAASQKAVEDVPLRTYLEQLDAGCKSPAGAQAGLLGGFNWKGLLLKLLSELLSGVLSDKPAQAQARA